MPILWLIFALAIVVLLASISYSLRKIARSGSKSRCEDSEKTQGEINVMFLLDATHDPVNFGVAITDIKDKEGNAVGREEVSVQVRVGDPTVLSTTYDESTDQGVVNFGAPGESAFTIDVVDKDDPSELLATRSWAFRLVAGDPSSVGSVSATFEGIEEAPEEPPTEPPA
mgnify:CR=1 FL=1